MVDLVLENGLIYDGTGAPPYTGNIGIKDDKIVSINNDVPIGSTRRIELDGLAVSPSFIDGHTHAEGYVIGDGEDFLGKVYQGVTTEILGNCGLSVFPIEAKYKADLEEYFNPFTGAYELNWDWSGLKSLSEKLKLKNMISNVGSLVGHGSLRIAAMGFDNRKPNKKELDKMVSLLNRAFNEGAVGLSLGLMYPPGLYADTRELIELSRVAAKHHRPVTSHIRNETFNLLESVEEMIQVATESDVRLIISHHKAVGKKNWGKLIDSLNMIDEANSKGSKIYIDVYPYTAGNTMLRSLLPPWALSGGVDKMIERLKDTVIRNEIRYWIEERKDWENLCLAGGWDSIMILSTRNHQEFEGRYLNEIAEEFDDDPIEFIMDLLIEEDGQSMVLLFTAWEEDLKAAMKKPYCMIVSDGIPAIDRTHPRLYGAFPRFLSNYVMKQNLMTLEQGIRRITSLPAEVYGLQGRGLLEEDAIADIIVFDPVNLSDNATYNAPKAMSEGIDYLFLAGRLLLDKGKIINNDLGRFICSGK